VQGVKAVIRRLLAMDPRRNRAQANMVFSFDSRKRQSGIQDRGGYQTRNVSTAHLLLEAAHAVREKLRKTFSVDIYTGDLLLDPPSRRHFAYCAALDQPQTVMIPDFIFWGWPEAGVEDYEVTQQAILDAARREPEDPQLFWIGNPETHPIRERFLELAAGDSRIHAGGLRWTSGTAGQRTRRLQTEGAAFVSLADHCRYRYLIDLEGAGYSGRLKLLLFCGRPLFVQTRRWREFFFDALVPFEHYIPVKEDLSDLSSQIDWAEANPDSAAAIARQGQEFAIMHLCRRHAIERLSQCLLALAE
jgi:hypothetical protein